MAVFDSNLPLYFDDTERAQFAGWLEHCGNNALEYKSPTYSNAEFDSYEVVEDEQGKIVGCGGIHPYLSFFFTNSPEIHFLMTL